MVERYCINCKYSKELEYDFYYLRCTFQLPPWVLVPSPAGRTVAPYLTCDLGKWDEDE